MSNLDDKNDKDNKDQNDPFSFFKLSTEPTKNDKNNKKKVPVWLLLTIGMILIVALNIFTMMGDDSAIDFSTFKQYIKDGKIVEVDLGNVYFVGYGPESNVDTSRSIEALLGGKKDSRTTYKTASIFTEGFIFISPLKSLSLPKIIFISVDFPDPFFPFNCTFSPPYTSILKLLNIILSP